MKPSTYRFLLLGAVLLAATTLFAATLEKQGKAWLDEHQDAAHVNVTGTWSSDFGDLRLEQAKESRDVTGSGGGYDLNGVVSGKTLYLLFSKNGTIGFCGIVTASSETTLVGQYEYRLSHLRFGAGSGVCQTKGYNLTLNKR
jgi:hypothetical protein